MRGRGRGRNTKGLADEDLGNAADCASEEVFCGVGHSGCREERRSTRAGRVVGRRGRCGAVRRRRTKVKRKFRWAIDQISRRSDGDIAPLKLGVSEVNAKNGLHGGIQKLLMRKAGTRRRRNRSKNRMHEAVM